MARRLEVLVLVTIFVVITIHTGNVVAIIVVGPFKLLRTLWWDWAYARELAIPIRDHAQWNSVLRTRDIA
jgi:hypothetical protein